ncbi:MAG: cytochrome c oxidase subunit 3 [Trueperaceae bacterium]|jgi:heme/copper-type cytochrome/quinol oxidase subunit 3|nr:cytochrome c oxidase subunit 3 [Truepera sp.]HRN17468.1 cytochrome c oxidase subunit 3 [Trueperaceae bacterium]HRQ09808.1 cytochrome c oxidase subunit 3 [Trueperaceae bacterium]
MSADASHASPAPAHVAPYRSSKLPDVKLLMWVFLASDTMFFGSLIGTYLAYHNRSLVGPLPRDVFDIPLTTISTFVLLMSSLLMVLSLHALRQNDISRFRLWTAGVAIFGSIFLGFQVFEFTHFVNAGLTVHQNLFGTTFFILTGTHGIHVTVGVIWLVSALITSYLRPTTAKDAVYLEIAGLYWHFVDIVWIVIFTVVYLVEFV